MKSFYLHFQLGEQRLVEIYLESMRDDKGLKLFLGQKLANTCSFVGGCIIVQQEKISRAECSWMNPVNALQEAIHCCFIKFYIYCFSLWYEFFVHCTLRVEKFISMVLMQDLCNFRFFNRGDVSPTHSELCCFVSVIGKTPGPTSRNNFVKKIFVCIGRQDNILARCDSIFPLLRC